MVRWATFAITKVRYNKAGTRILQVIPRRDLGDRLGKPVIRTRQQIVIAIGKRYTYVTTYKDKDGWVIGDKVFRFLSTIQKLKGLYACKNGINLN